MLDKIKVGAWFNDEQVAEFNFLTAFTFKRYKIMLPQDNVRQVKGKTIFRNVWVADSGTGEFRSWIKQIEDPHQLKRQVWNPLEAMRNAITPEMRFQEQTLGNYCVKCNSQTNLTVDHKDTPFSVIAEAFIEAYPDIETCTHESGMGHAFKDKELEQKFIAVHNEIATYQLLCRSCNSKKGAGV